MNILEQPHPSTIRYSIAFRQKVVSEIESGRFKSLGEVTRCYGMSRPTLSRWIRRYGKYDSNHVKLRVEMKDEADKIKEQAKRIKELESALANSHVENVMLKARLQYHGVDPKGKAKKKSGSKS